MPTFHNGGGSTLVSLIGVPAGSSSTPRGNHDTLPGALWLTTLEYWAALQGATELHLESCEGSFKLPHDVQRPRIPEETDRPRSWTDWPRSISIGVRRRGTWTSELSVAAASDGAPWGKLLVQWREQTPAVDDPRVRGETFAVAPRSKQLPAWFCEQFPQLATRLAPPQAAQLLLAANQVNVSASETQQAHCRFDG